MAFRFRTVLVLILGLAAAAGACAQGAAPRAGAVIRALQGTLTVQSGAGAVQSARAGAAIPVGAMMRTGTDSSAILVFPDGQVCALGGNVALRIAAFAYNPREASRNEISLNLTDGSLRCVLGAIAQLNPAGVRVQVGVATVGVTPSSAPRTDASAVAQAGAMAVTVDRGSVVVFLPSGQQQQIAAGQGLFFGQDGTMVAGPTAKIVQELASLPLSDRKEFAELEDAGKNIAVTVFMLSDPGAAQALLSPLDSLPPPGDIAAAPETGITSTPPTGAGGGGLPCSASCN